MKTLNKLLKQIIVALAFLVVTGCVSPTLVTLSSPTSTNTPGSLPLPTATLPRPATEPTPFITSMPTLLPDQVQKMGELLQNENCKLPCYLGIIPGTTSMNQAHSTLKSLGANFGNEINISGNTYYLEIGDPLVPNVTPGSTALVYQNLRLGGGENGGVVASIHIRVGTEKIKEAVEIYRKYWARYSAKQIFTQLGQPDKLFIASRRRGHGIGSALIIVYEQRGVYIDLRGTGHETNICSDTEAQQISLEIDIFDQSSSLITEKLNPYLNDPTVWLPIKDALGIDSREFYRLVVTYPSVCFLY